MDDLVTVSHVDTHRPLYEFIVDTLMEYAIPSHMKMSYVVHELMRRVSSPHGCLYDGLLGNPMERLELCERIASFGRTRARRSSSETHLFVPLRLEHWLIRHLVTVHLRANVRRIEYYDPNGTGYEHETRAIVGLTTADDASTTPRWLIEQVMQLLPPGWTAHSIGVQHQGILSPLACGRLNIEYIEACVSPP
jgi:hypothetical protein